MSTLERSLKALVRCLAILTLQTVASGESREYEAPEPYKYLNGHIPDARPAQPASPDPLVRMTWGADVDASELQIYRVFAPKSYTIDPPDSIVGAETLSTAQHRLEIRKAGTIQLDWGLERAAWLEFTLRDGKPDGVTMTASLSEWNRPYPGKTREVKQYGNFTYRLETNKELYEGIRFTWLTFENITDPIVIDSISLVAKIKPVNYTGWYESSDFELTQAWYTGAYAVRLNMEAHDLNTVLVERGDRVAIQGDGHPTIEASLVAFSPFELVANVLNKTDSGDHYVVDQSIMSYPLYWCLSVLDWFMASGDYDTFQGKLVYDVMKVVDERIRDFLDPNIDMVWMGWDDRLGNGWCPHKNNDDCGREAQLTLAGLVIRVCNDLSLVLSLLGMADEATRYQEEAAAMKMRFQQVPEWPRGLGTHSVGNAINAGLVELDIIEYWMENTLSNPVTICSFSPFNQYWILQAFGNAGEIEYALASIKLCWGPQLRLGKGCFWELTSPDWETFMQDGDEAPGLMSYCHPWSSGVTAWQTHVHAGIEPVLPGYKKIMVAPFVSSRYPSVAAAVSTPMGDVAVNATFDHGMSSAEIRLHLVLPSNGYVGISTKSIFDVAPCSRDESHCDISAVVNDEPQELSLLSDFKDISPVLHSRRFAGYQFLNLDQAGTYDVVVRHMTCDQVQSVSPMTDNNFRKRSIAPFPEPNFPARVDTDYDARGDGMWDYGADGYVLLGYDHGRDKVNLPAYVKDVRLRQHGWGAGWINTKRSFVGESTSDPSFLPENTIPSNGTNRALGMVGHDGSLGPQVNNSILVDVEFDNGDSFEREQVYYVSLYCVGGITTVKQAFRVMNLESLDPIAPTSMIKMDPHEGVWWTVQYNQSLRVRVINIESLHISAVAFSKSLDPLPKETS